MTFQTSVHRSDIELPARREPDGLFPRVFGGAANQHPLDLFPMGGGTATSSHVEAVKLCCTCNPACEPLVNVLCHWKEGGDDTPSRLLTFQPSLWSRILIKVESDVGDPTYLKPLCTTTWDQPNVPALPSQLTWCGSIFQR
jgi:hypothetical protein